MYYYCADPEEAKEVKERTSHLIDRSHKVIKKDGKVYFPLMKNICDSEIKGHIVELDSPLSKEVEEADSVIRCEVYPPSILVYEEHSENLYKALCEAKKCKYVILKQRIDKADIRSPRTKLLYSSTSESDDVYAMTKQNDCGYKWYPLHSMFCRGNIAEKIRMSKLHLEQHDEIILDLYAGIGYWTLPLLINNPSASVIACDLNPWSIKALRENLIRNKVQERCTVLEGDNAQFVDFYRGKCGRIILGLLPSSQKGWPLAIEALKASGGILHIHENVPKTELLQFQETMKQSLMASWTNVKSTDCLITVEKITCVKSYSPKVFHYVFDVFIKAAQPTI